MNKSQKVVIGIFLILMGIISFFYAGEITRGFTHFRSQVIIAVYLMILLGIAFVGGGFFILFSKKKRSESWESLRKED